MAEELYRCTSCGKGFKTAQGLAGHKRYCQKVGDQSQKEAGVAELRQRISNLEEKYKTLSQQYTGSLERLDNLKELVDLLIHYVCPGGKNYVGINSSRIIELSHQVDVAQKDLIQREKTFEREIKGWVWTVIPEQFRPKIWPAKGK
jgi:hypothetical protein